MRTGQQPKGLQAEPPRAAHLLLACLQQQHSLDHLGMLWPGLNPVKGRHEVSQVQVPQLLS